MAKSVVHGAPLPAAREAAKATEPHSIPVFFNPNELPQTHHW